MIDGALETAFRATSYRVGIHDGSRFVIRIDSRCEPLDELLISAGTTTWAYITACNPRAQRLGDADNHERMARLEAVVRDHGFAFLHGDAVADASGWPAEPSLLVLGIGASEAAGIARDFGQHALVTGCLGKPARLVWTRAST